MTMKIIIENDDETRTAEVSVVGFYLDTDNVFKEALHHANDLNPKEKREEYIHSGVFLKIVEKEILTGK